MLNEKIIAMMKPALLGQYEPLRVPFCLAVGMRGWCAGVETLLKGQLAAQDRDNPERTTTLTIGRMPLRGLLLPQGRDASKGTVPGGMMSHIPARASSLHS